MGEENIESTISLGGKGWEDGRKVGRIEAIRGDFQRHAALQHLWSALFGNDWERKWRNCRKFDVALVDEPAKYDFKCKSEKLGGNEARASSQHPNKKGFNEERNFEWENKLDMWHSTLSPFCILTHLPHNLGINRKKIEVTMKESESRNEFSSICYLLDIQSLRRLINYEFHLSLPKAEW